MKRKGPDFSGWATVYGTLCGDGRTINRGAFDHMDGETVPLVFQHNHQDPEMIVGKAVLHADPNGYGIRCDGYFNSTAKAKSCRKICAHGDINALSIWANKLKERGGMVQHGQIREVSLVLSGANPAARIDYTALAHSGGEATDIYSEAVIYGGEMEDIYCSEDSEDGDIEHMENPTVGTLLTAYNALSDGEKAIFDKALNAAANKAGSEALAEKTAAIIRKKDHDNQVKLCSLLVYAAKKGGLAHSDSDGSILDVNDPEYRIPARDRRALWRVRMLARYPQGHYPDGTFRDGMYDKYGRFRRRHFE